MRQRRTPFGLRRSVGDRGGGCSGGWPGQGGVVFKLDTHGTYTVIHTFNGADGAETHAALLRDNQGNLYGSTEYGGDLNSQQGWCGPGYGCGVVFKISACSSAICRGGSDADAAGTTSGLEDLTH